MRGQEGGLKVAGECQELPGQPHVAQVRVGCGKGGERGGLRWAEEGLPNPRLRKYLFLSFWAEEGKGSARTSRDKEQGYGDGGMPSATRAA